MKEFEKLLFEDFKRQECEKASLEVELGLFEQKEESTFDFTLYTKMSSKKYKRLYDLYRNDQTGELVYVCPLVENNEGAEDERKDMAPYAYDVLYLEYLDAETYEKVKKAGIHETSHVPTLYVASWVAYFTLLALNIAVLIFVIIQQGGFDFTTYMLVAGSILGSTVISTCLLTLVSIKYHNYKAR